MKNTESESKLLKNEIIKTEENKGCEQKLIDKKKLKDYDSTTERFNTIIQQSINSED